MAIDPTNTTQLRSTIERISAEVQGLGAEVWDAASESRSGNESEGLLGRVAELWPEVETPGGPILSLAALERAEAALTEERTRAADTLAESRARIKRVGRAWVHQLRRARRWEAAALAVVAAAGKEVADLRGAEERARAEALAHRLEIRRLNRWLAEITPRGLRRFADGQGRVFTRSELAEIEESKQEAAAGLRAAEADAEDAAKAVILARARQKAAEDDLSQARQFTRKLIAKRPVHGARLREAARAFKTRRGELAGIKVRLQRLVELKREYRQALGLAGRILEQAETEPVALERAEELLGRCRRAHRDCRVQGERAGRMARLIRRQEAGLSKRSKATTALSRRATALNREIAALEDELPGLIGPLSEGAPPEDRRRAAAMLATLLGRCGTVEYRAAEADSELKGLVRYLTGGLDRAKALTESWREAGRAERASLAEAEGFAAQAAEEAGALRLRAEETVASFAPLAGLLEIIDPVDLAHGLKPIAVAVQGLKTAAADIDGQLKDISGQAPPALTAGSLARTPAKLKPHSLTLRRLAKRGVWMERLWAVSEAARRWHSLAEGRLADEIRRPLAQERDQLTGRVRELDREKSGVVLERDEAHRRIGDLRSDLERERGQQAHLSILLDESRTQGAKSREELLHTRQRLSVTTNARDEALALLEGYEAAAEAAEKLTRDLGRYRRMSAALKTKAVERHRSLSEARRIIAKGAEEQERARSLERELAFTRQRLDEAEGNLHLERIRAEQRVDDESRSRQLAAELEAARRRLGDQEQLTAELEFTRNELRKQANLESELRAARGRLVEQERLSAELEAAREGLVDQERLTAELEAAHRQLGEKQRLTAELEAARQEAERWSNLSATLSTGLALIGGAGSQEAEEMKAELAGLREQVATLDEQLQRLTLVLVMATSGAGGADGPGGPGSLSGEQLSKVLDRLAAARRRLAKIGRATMGHWTLVAALTAGMVLFDPYPPSKATHRTGWEPPPITATLMAPSGPVQSLAPEFNLDLKASGKRLPGVRQKASLELSLMPLRSDVKELPAQIKLVVERIARQAGLSADVLLASARTAYSNRAMVEMKALRRLADAARRIMEQTPAIYGELRRHGSAPNLAHIVSKAESTDYQVRFSARMYQEYRSLGFSPDEALGALAADELAVSRLRSSWCPPEMYKGKVLPLGYLEGMGPQQFVKRMTPYITSRIHIFLRCRKMTFGGDVKRYARDLAFDMYAAAKRFQVPVTFMAAIAHQETWYANVLGDQDLSASPYQIYRPTRHLIIQSMARDRFVTPPKTVQLERHITLATYMAAYHLRELMFDAYHPARGRRAAWVDMNRVMKSYNGSSLYAGRVAGRRAELAKFLAKTRGPSAAEHTRLKTSPSRPKL